MNVGIFGGTFDPIHRGHIALARAALERLDLSRIYFVPSSLPPHRQNAGLTSYFHRYAMVVLATIGEKAFVPSLLEAPADPLPTFQDKKTKPESRPNYSIDTVHRLKQSLKKADRLFFLIGIDAFSEIAKWHQAEALFHEVEFVVASRPGYSLADVANALPESLRPAAAVTKPFAKQAAKGKIVLRGATVHLLDNVHQPISATNIRAAIKAKKSLAKYLDEPVIAYIKKMGLYQS